MKKIKPGQYVLLLIFGISSLASLLPILLVLIASFTSEASLTRYGFRFFPQEWSLDSWKYVLGYGTQLIVSYGVTIFITVVGTLASLLVISMLAYTLARDNFVLRKLLTIMLITTMLFKGGQLSDYMINTSVYHLRDTLLVLTIPTVTAMNVIIMRTYIKSNISNAMIESAKIDGASEFRIYSQIAIPLMPPVLASVGFMLAIGYWNEWQKAFMYISSRNKMPLQLLLIRMEKTIEAMNNPELPTSILAEMVDVLPAEGARMALLMMVLGPIMVAYPFFQKYFIKGLTIGSVKG